MLNRRNFLSSTGFAVASLASVPFVGTVGAEANVRTLLDASDGEPLVVEKPLVTEEMAKVLLAQAGKARRQGMHAEASILAEAARKLLALPGKVGVLPCDTDADCERKNPHLQGEKADPLGLRSPIQF